MDRVSAALSGTDVEELDEGQRRLGLVGQFRRAVRRLKRQVRVLYYAAWDPQLPWTSKFLARLAVAYALSPIDLVPDAVPVLGLLDDLVVLPGLIWLAVKFIPPSVMERAEMAAATQPIRLRDNYQAAVIVLALWDVSAILVLRWLCTRLGNDWLRHNWPAVAAPLAAALFIGEALWLSSRKRKDEAEDAATMLAEARQVLSHSEPLLTADHEPG